MIFPNVKSLTILEGKATKISSGGVLLWSAGRIPSEYQEVEWIGIGNGNNSYLDLGFAFNKGATIYFKYNKVGLPNYLFGAAENSGKLRCMITATGSEIALYGSNGSAYIQTRCTDNIGEHSLICTLKKGCLKIEDLVTGSVSTVFTTQAEYTMTNNLHLLAQNYNGASRQAYNAIEVKAFSYYDNYDNLICDLVPCYRKSDGEIGMYDIVRKIFLENQYTNMKFIKGADV